MKGNALQNMQPMSFKEAVTYYMTKLKSPEKIIKQFLDTEDEESMALFEKAILYLREKQGEAA